MYIIINVGVEYADKTVLPDSLSILLSNDGRGNVITLQLLHNKAISLQPKINRNNRLFSSKGFIDEKFDKPLMPGQY